MRRYRREAKIPGKSKKERLPFGVSALFLEPREARKSPEGLAPLAMGC